MSTTWDALQARLDGLKRPTTTYTICEDPEARQRLYEARANLHAAEDALTALGDGDEETERADAQARVKAAKGELAIAQKAFDKVAITLTFQALERKQLAELEAQHAANEQEEAEGSEYASSFAPALISAASLDGMPVDYARRCLDTWSLADAVGLYEAAVAVQRTQRADLGKG